MNKERVFFSLSFNLFFEKNVERAKHSLSLFDNVGFGDNDREREREGRTRSFSLSLYFFLPVFPVLSSRWPAREAAGALLPVEAEEEVEARGEAGGLDTEVMVR